MTYRVLDTFAGAGGFSLGFEMAGATIVGAIEQDEWATDTFKANHPNTLVIKSKLEDLNDSYLKNNFRNIDILLGGPPCQGFSIANKKNGDPKDPRNSLFQEFLRVAKLLEPRIVIMENVPNLLNAKTADKTPVIEIIETELRELGYFVYKTILEAQNYGVPQIRKRLFVIASKHELTKPFPDATHSTDAASGLQPSLTLWDAISDLPPILAREGAEVSEYTLEPQTHYQKVLRKNSIKLQNHKAMNHSKRLVERFQSMKWGQSTSDVPNHLKPIKRNSNEVSTAVYDQNNRRMHPNKPCHTIAASFYANFVHPYLDRNFTAREGARIQSFPDDYIFLGKPTVVSHKLLQREGRFDEKYLCQYNQIGNAVPPLLAFNVAKNLFIQLENITHE